MANQLVDPLRAIIQGAGGDRTARNVAAAMFIVLVILVPLYAGQYGPEQRLMVAVGGFLIALCAAAIGGFLGFLFGLPRRAVVTAGASAVQNPATGQPPAAGQPLAPAQVAPSYTSNTNLEDISDWVTKILVGITLTQLGSLPAIFDGLIKFLQGALQSGDLAANAGAIAAMLAVAYAIGGFFVAYLWARLRFGAALADADREIAAAQLRRQAAALHRDAAQFEVEAAQQTQEAATMRAGTPPPPPTPQ